jgi:hypothetical protein
VSGETAPSAQRTLDASRLYPGNRLLGAFGVPTVSHLLSPRQEGKAFFSVLVQIAIESEDDLLLLTELRSARSPHNAEKPPHIEIPNICLRAREPMR